MPNEKKCCDDEERTCTADCVAYNPEGFTIVRLPQFDRSLPTPQWTWTGTEARRAIVCLKNGFTIQVLEKIEPKKELDDIDRP